VAELRAWRLSEARRRRVPAFRILSDRVLVAVAEARPRDESTLLGVNGVGPALLRRHGRALLALLGGGARSPSGEVGIVPAD
jgi:DNA topoisomerase-3